MPPLKLTCQQRNLNFDWLSETILREQEINPQSQSLYDTYISDSETEAPDHYLPMLRGHISAVPTRRIATIFVISTNDTSNSTAASPSAAKNAL